MALVPLISCMEGFQKRRKTHGPWWGQIYVACLTDCLNRSKPSGYFKSRRKVVHEPSKLCCNLM